MFAEMATVNRKTRLECGGKACSKCGKCTDWYYANGLKRRDGATCSSHGDESNFFENVLSVGTNFIASGIGAAIGGIIVVICAVIGVIIGVILFILIATGAFGANGLAGGALGGTLGGIAGFIASVYLADDIGAHNIGAALIGATAGIFSFTAHFFTGAIGFFVAIVGGILGGIIGGIIGVIVSGIGDAHDDAATCKCK